MIGSLANMNSFGPLVDADWLADHRAEVVVFDSRKYLDGRSGREQFELGHIPGAVFVDLRSPAEYAEDHLPGAVNVPLFDDAERALIGTLYARRSPAEAFAAASERARERIGHLTRTIADLAGWSPPAVGADGLKGRFDALAERGITALEVDLEPGRPERQGELGVGMPVGLRRRPREQLAPSDVERELGEREGRCGRLGHGAPTLAEVSHRRRWSVRTDFWSI